MRLKQNIDMPILSARESIESIVQLAATQKASKVNIVKNLILLVYFSLVFTLLSMRFRFSAPKMR
jgi:hypothetical protein